MQTQAASKPSELAQRAQRESSINVALHGNADAFKLTLSLFDGGRPALINWQHEPPVTDEHFPQRLNHYRRPATQCSEAALNTYLRWQQSVSKAPSTQAIQFWQSMHPDPLNFTDNPKQLPVDVKINCAYGTQLQLHNEMQSAMVMEAEEAPTLLADTIPASQQLIQ